MAGLQTQTQTRDDPCSASSMTLPPKVEITVEQLDGIIWSTPLPADKDDLKKRVPFVTAAVEFAGTCPSMKVYSATSFPHSKNPAVESYFASLDDDPWVKQQSQVGASEVKKIISTILKDGTTTTTTTTTVTTTTTPVAPRHKDGHYPLVAKWHDDSCDEKLIDSITYFTSPRSFDGSESGATSFSKKANRPHLTLTLPSAADQERPSLLTSMLTPCHHHEPESTVNSSCKHSSAIVPTQTHSTAASTSCSNSSGRNSAQNQQQSSVHSQSQGGNSSSPFHDLGSLLDQDKPRKTKESEAPVQPPITRQDEADVSPVVATKKSKELVATAIAAEPSSAIVGQTDTNKGAFTPLSWMACGTAAPEIVELRVRVMPEDADDFDEMDPSKQHLAAAQDLEGVAHLVFLDQIIEEGTTVMDLPLKISNDKVVKRRDTTSILSTTPAVGDQDFVTLGANAMLRVRVTILPQGRKQVAPPPPPPPTLSSASFFDRLTVQETQSMKTQSLPDSGLPFYSRPLSLTQQVLPFMERVFHFQYLQEKISKVYSQGPFTKEEKKAPKSRVPFPTVDMARDDKSKNVDSKFLGDWKTYGESWSWLGFSNNRNNKAKSTGGRTSRGSSRKKRSDPRHETKKFYVPQSSSTMSESSEEDASSIAGTDLFPRSLQ